VFTDELGRAIHPMRAYVLFRELMWRNPLLPKIRLHDLRHTAATLALAAGVHPKVVQERLGHANIAITLDTYSHVVEGLQEDAAARVAVALTGLLLASWRRWALALVLPYARLRLPRADHPRRFHLFAERVAVDMAQFVGMHVGALRYGLAVL
jgi:hypothetical protein